MIQLVSIMSEPDAEELLYEMLRERSQEDDPYVNISHRALPSMKEHLRFVRSRPYRAWYLIKSGEQYVGQIYSTKRNEIGIVLMRAHRGRGLGSKAVAEFIKRHRPLPAIPGERAGAWLANINPLNTRSISMFTLLGFTLKQQTYEFRGGTK